MLPLVKLELGDLKLLFSEGGSCAFPEVGDEDFLEARRDGGEDGLAALAVPDSAHFSFMASSSR